MKYLSALLVMLMIASASFSDFSDLDLESELEPDAHLLVNGIALHDKSGIKFKAALFTERPASNPAEILQIRSRMEMQAAKNLSLRRLKKYWVQGAAINNSPETYEQQQKNVLLFTGSLKDKLLPGDRLTIDNLPNGETRIFVNGIKLVTISGPGFYPLLLNSWVGAVPPSSEFRDALLANGEVNEMLLAEYNRTVPTTTAVERIKKWKTPAVPSAQPKLIIQGPEHPDIDDSTTPPLSSRHKNTAVSAKSSPPPIPQRIQVSTGAGAAAKDRSPPSPSKQPPASAPKPVSSTPMSPLPLKSNALKSNANTIAVEENEIEEEWDVAAYYHSMHKAIANYFKKKYPNWNNRGKVVLSMRVGHNGSVEEVEFVKKSHSSKLNNAAVQSVKSAGPYGMIPMSVVAEERWFTHGITVR